MKSPAKVSFGVVQVREYERTLELGVEYDDRLGRDVVSKSSSLGWEFVQQRDAPVKDSKEHEESKDTRKASSKPLFGRAALRNLAPLLVCILLWACQIGYIRNGKYDLAKSRKMDGMQQQLDAPRKKKVRLKKEDDLHHSNLGILGLQDWETKSLEKPYSDSCQPPEGVNEFCCLGTPTHEVRNMGKKVLHEWRDTCSHLSLQDYQQQQQLAHKELAAMTEDDDDDNLCDACRIVELLRQQNLTFAFFGDSVSSQIANAFLCELQRRQYNVTIDLPPVRQGDGFRNFREIRRLSIQSSTWQNGTNISGSSAVVLDFIFQYRLPFLFPEQRDMITSHYDVLVVNFGQHWVYEPKPDNNWEMERYNKDTLPRQLKTFLNKIHEANKVQLLAWRENAATHFDANGGEYSLARSKPGFKEGNATCVPHYDHTPNRSLHGWREQSFRQAIPQTNYTVVTAGQHMPPVDNGNSELVVLPFYDFSSQGHAFHSQFTTTPKAPDCVHFCYSPFLYLPIWRGLRLSMDRSFSGDEVTSMER